MYCAATQALSKRIHYGKFVAEAKFQSQTARYTELIRRGDMEGIMDALTDRAVELKVPLLCCCVMRRILEWDWQVRRLVNNMCNAPTLDSELLMPPSFRSATSQCDAVGGGPGQVKSCNIWPGFQRPASVAGAAAPEWSLQRHQRAAATQSGA